MYRIVVLFTVLSFIISSCGPTSLDDVQKRRVSFDSLPDTVKVIYQDQLNQTNSFSDYCVISTDKSIDFRHEHTGMDNGVFTALFRGFNHHFYVNGKHFKLQANKGDPFILYDKKLYYTLELNLADYNYKTATYIEVDLKEYLK